MMEILGGIKRDDGIHVMWQEGNETKAMFFGYNELIDMKINALDLLENPRWYRVDVEGHRIVMVT
jgi:hypothetical protein